MKGLRHNARADRQRVVDMMVPLIQRKFGDNLAALAVTASFARGDDGPYSDLEIMAFVKEMPPGPEMRTIARVHDGMLVELQWLTRETYLKRIKDVNREWYLSGSDRLQAIVNAPFVEELKAWAPENLRGKCLRRAHLSWPETLEMTGKVLNALEAGNHEGICLLACSMLDQMLVTLSYLNQHPYTTFARFIAEGKDLPIKPPRFTELIALIEAGRFHDFERLRELTTDVVAGFEAIFRDEGVDLYADALDPAEPGIWNSWEDEDASNRTRKKSGDVEAH